MVDLTVSQQVSNFVVIDIGMSTSLKFIKKEIRTTLSLADGDIIVLSVLTECKESKGANGLSFR